MHLAVPCVRLTVHQSPLIDTLTLGLNWYLIVNASSIWFGVSNGVAGSQVTAWSDHNKQAQFAELYSTAEADQQASVTEQRLTACLAQ